MTAANQALYEVMYSHLNNASALWGTRVQPLMAANAQLARPFVVYFEASNQRRLSAPTKKMAEILLSVKGISDSMANAMAISDAITTLLDDSGAQDVNPRLPYHAGWQILTVTEGRSIWVEEKFAGAADIYHAGHQYLFVMERR